MSGSENLAKVGVSLFPSLQAAVGQVRGPTIAFVRIDVVPPHRRARDAPAARKNFVRQPKRTFSTVSTHSRRRARLRPPRQFSPGSSQSIESESLSWRRRHPIAPRPILIGAYLRACSFLLACLQLVGQRPQGLRHVVEALLPFRARHECENGLVAR